MLKNQIIVATLNSTPRQLYIFSFGFISIICLLFFLYERRIDRSIQKLKTEKTEVERKLNSVNCTEIEGKISLVKNEISQLLPKQIISMDRIFLHLIRDSGLKINTLLPEEDNGNLFNKMNLNLSLTGSFEQILNYLKELSKINSVLNCKELNLKKEEELISFESKYEIYSSIKNSD